MAVFFFALLSTAAVSNKETCYPWAMESKLSYCDYLLCDADFQLLKMLVVCGWGVGSGWDSHGESLAVVPGLAWMKIWVGASKVSCNAFFIITIL